jgi:general secretion pathway protein F
MAIYTYKGLDKKGKEVKGSVNGDNEFQAKQKLKTMKIMLLEISEEKSKKKSSGISFGTGINIQDISLMTRQLATLIKAKVQIVEAFSALQEQAENPTLMVILSEIKQKVNEGSSLANAFADYPKVFSNVYVNMVDAGETSGTLELVLIRLAEFSESQVKLKNRIKGAMTYPLVILIAGGLMMLFIFIFIIPKITKVFISMKKTLPLQTQICIWLSKFLQSYWWAVILGMAGGSFLFNKYIETKKGKSIWHAVLLKLPIVGGLTKMINISRFCSTLSTLLNSGVPILAAMKIVKNLIGNVHMASAVDEARVAVSEGASIVGPLIKSGHFPVMVTHMIKLGERSGELEPMLTIVAENYEDQVDAKLGGLTSIIEPIMMLGMGLAVGFIVFAVVMPMMELNSLK